MIGLMCSTCLWNRLEIVPATHFARGIGSYYDAQTDVVDAVIAVCADCAPKWGGAKPYAELLDEWVAQERRVHGQRSGRLALPRWPGDCDHETVRGIAFTHVPSGRIAEQCQRCLSVRVRYAAADPWGAWVLGNPEHIAAYRQQEEANP